MITGSKYNKKFTDMLIKQRNITNMTKIRLKVK